MGVILREVIPDGTMWGIKGDVIPHWTNLEFGQDLKTASSIEFTCANNSPVFDRLRTGMYVVPEIDGRTNWYDSVFYVTEKSGSNMPNNHGTTRFAGRSLRGRLDSVRWMPAIGSQYIDQEGFRYTNVTPGDVIKAGVENYLSRARNTYKDASKWISGVPVGVGWIYRVDEIIQPGTSISEMISKYQDLGIASSRFEGFELVTGHYHWFTEAASRDKTESVQLKVGVNLVRGEYSESIETVTTALLVRGAEDPFRSDEENNLQTNVIQWVVADQSVINKYGYHEEILDVGDASNPATLKSIGDNYLKRHLEPRYSKTYTMVDSLYDSATGKPLNIPKAFVDFQCGDSILILADGGSSVETVYAITCSYSNPSQESASIGLTLNDYFDSWSVKFDQRLKRLGG